jgi:hypothetical protein
MTRGERRDDRSSRGHAGARMPTLRPSPIWLPDRDDTALPEHAYSPSFRDGKN